MVYGYRGEKDIRRGIMPAKSKTPLFPALRTLCRRIFVHEKDRESDSGPEIQEGSMVKIQKGVHSGIVGIVSYVDGPWVHVDRPDPNDPEPRIHSYRVRAAHCRVKDEQQKSQMPSAPPEPGQE